MLAKRFAPTLLGIPEEDQLQQESTVGSVYGGRSSKHGSFRSISLKRENSRRRGCPGCALEMNGFPTIQEQSSACQSCTPISAAENKQHSIRKWLEDVPVGKTSSFKSSDVLLQNDANSLVSKPAGIKTPVTRSSHKGRAPAIPTQEELPKRNKAIDSAILAVHKELEVKTNSSKMIPAPPPPPISVLTESQHFKDRNNKLTAVKSVSCPPPPPLPSPTKSEEIRFNSTPKIKKKSGEPPVTKQLMDAVQELVGQRGLEIGKSPDKIIKSQVKEIFPDRDDKKSQEEFEADSLERAASENEKGLSTPTDYGDVPSQPSPTLSSALPLEEEMTMRNEIFNVKTGNKTISKLKLDNSSKVLEKVVSDDHEYEIIVLNPDVTSTSSNKDIKLYNLPELLNHNDGYSLVSEVYVNDGYNFGSLTSSPSNTSTSSGPKIRYSEPVEKPGHLTIQVEDSPENYIQYPDDSDSFEPDTLDRKPNRHKHEDTEPLVRPARKQVENYNDSLERPVQILLRTTGSFRSDSLSQAGSDDLTQILNGSPLNRGFGSLREIYEARYNYRNEADNVSLVGSTRSLNNEMDTFSRRRSHHYSKSGPRSVDGVILNPEAKQAKRQRAPTPPGLTNGLHKPKPPDAMPPLPPKASAIYEDPPPPRPIYKIEPTPPLPPRTIKPPLPPKNGCSRSTREKRTISNLARRPLPPLPVTKRSPFGQDISTMSSTSTIESRDLETLSNLSGASVDSLNESDYEAFYMAPYSGDEEQDGSQTLGHRVEKSLTNKFPHFQQQIKPRCDLNSQFILQPVRSTAQLYENGSLKKAESVENKNNNGDSPTSEKTQSLDKDIVKHLRDKRGADSVKKTWRRMIESNASKVIQKPEDSGYLSTDSNDSRKRHKMTKTATILETETQSSSHGQGSVSETDESLCDGASESGAESIATDSFFFGNFRKLSTCAKVTESVDSGVGSDLIRTLNNPALLEDAGGTSSDSENVSFVTVLPPGSSQRRSSIRC
ncbi:hypothetical protein L9F63_019741 [Diploptera punctata]|uniref:Uncharacterized protein n=1 Tax=Diploptera punctata TaxID=6984 RepID=A0AAD7ZUF4_DIPPU|nr:hypothetical protein L9F63_019741 [Diploptera punctata]